MFERVKLIFRGKKLQLDWLAINADDITNQSHSLVARGKPAYWRK
jgi:hypothetical protein